MKHFSTIYLYYKLIYHEKLLTANPLPSFQQNEIECVKETDDRFACVTIYTKQLIYQIHYKTVKNNYIRKTRC